MRNLEMGASAPVISEVQRNMAEDRKDMGAGRQAASGTLFRLKRHGKLAASPSSTSVRVRQLHKSNP